MSECKGCGRLATVDMETGYQGDEYCPECLAAGVDQDDDEIPEPEYDDPGPFGPSWEPQDDAVLLE